MAYTILDLGYTSSAGIQYTATTDTSADWGDVDNETYFFDKQTELVYFKDANGNVGSIYTSVGLTMPTAFSVANSPITQSGSLDVTANGVASQYIRGDGTLADFPIVTGGGSAVVYYFNGGTNQGTFSGGTYYELSKTAILGSNADFSTAVDGVISQFITDALDPNLLLIPAGNWVFGTYFSASSSGGNPRFSMELLKWNGTTFTSIANNSANPESITGGTNTDIYFSALAVPETILLATDRLAIRVSVICDGKTLTLHTQANHLSQVTTTFAIGLTALNGLTDQVQYFQTGTSGTDFGISSSTDIHTFNLPVASATNTGKLSATDWSTFNGKVSAGAITSSGLTMATSRLLGRTTAGNGAVEEITIGTGLTLSAGTLTAVSSVGVWGISNSSGVYTFYSTLTLAMASATAGQTIEMFADVTETANVTIAMKSGVNINGNGHTYTYTNNSGIMFSFSSNSAGTFAFYNINITRTNTASAGAEIFAFSGISVYITSRIDFSGCVIRYNVTSGNSIVMSGDSLHSFIVNNLTCITNGGGTAVLGNNTSSTINNCYIECTGTSGGFSTGIAKQSIIITQSGTGIGGSGSTIYECVINCLTSGIGVLNVNGAYNCQVTTNTGACFDGQGLGSQTIYNCIARSVSGSCFYSTIAQNCQAYSTSGNAIALHFNYNDGRYKFYNCFLYSAGAIVSNAGRISLLNCTIVSGWNNAGGHAVRMDNTTFNEVSNCVIDVTNASANCINSVSSATIKYANTSFRTSTTPVSATITQGLINTQDNQGNILL